MTEIDEAEVLAAARTGSDLDGDAGGARRTVQAAVLRRCCHELAAEVDPRGLRLRNVAIAGRLDLAGHAVAFPLRFQGCEFESALAVEGADLFELALIQCPVLPGLLGNGLRLRRDLDLSGSTVVGAHWTSASTSKQSAVWLCESEIGGRVLCIDSTIDGVGGRCLQADRMRVAGLVRFIHGFTAHGEIRMIGARIDGSLDLDGAHLQASDGPAIDLADSVIGGSLFLTEDPDGRKPVIDGRFDAGSASISGRFLIRNATIGTAADVAKGSIYTRSKAVGTAIDAPRLSVGSEVTFESCEVIGRIDMSMSDVSSLSIGAGCAFRAPGRTALDLTNAEVRALLRLDQKATIEGTLRMAGATIHGTLALHGTLTGPAENLSIVGGSAMTVDGDVYLMGLRASGGRVNFQGATLGSVQAAGARLHNPDGYALRLSQAVIKGSVRLDEEFTAVGLVTVSRSTIEGRLQLTDGIFTCPGPAPGNPHGHALEVRSAVVRGGIDLGWRHVAPSVDFSDTTTTHLADDPHNWPDHYAISGLSYERFENPQGAPPRRIWDQAARCAWLSRQTEFDSGPYEQAARVFRQHGYTDEAERILIAERRHAYRVNHAGAAWPTRVFDTLYAAVGYGYRPSRVLWLLAVLLVLVAGSLELPVAQATLRANNGNGVVFSTAGALAPSGRAVPGANRSVQVDACGDGQVRCFSPVLYAVDTVIPLISLDQRSTWYPDPHAPWGEVMLWWLNLATMLGWLLSSIFVLSLTRLARTS